MESKQIPINLEDLASKEFLISVRGHEFNEYLKKNEQKSLQTKLYDGLKKILGIPERETNAYMVEVLSRTKSSFAGDFWEELAYVVSKDGTSLGKQVSEVEGKYIFNFEEFVDHEIYPVSLLGSVQEYNLETDEVNPERQEVLVNFYKTPQNKLSGIKIGMI